jgi:hypothetical protein
LPYFIWLGPHGQGSKESYPVVSYHVHHSAPDIIPAMTLWCQKDLNYILLREMMVTPYSPCPLCLTTEKALPVHSLFPEKNGSWWSIL